MATWSAKRNDPSRFVGDVDVGSFSSWWFSPAARRGADIRSLRPPIRYKFESRGSGRAGRGPGPPPNPRGRGYRAASHVARVGVPLPPRVRIKRFV